MLVYLLSLHVMDDYRHHIVVIARGNVWMQLIVCRVMSLSHSCSWRPLSYWPDTIVSSYFAAATPLAHCRAGGSSPQVSVQHCVWPPRVTVERFKQTTAMLLNVLTAPTLSTVTPVQAHKAAISRGLAWARAWSQATLLLHQCDVTLIEKMVSQTTTGFHWKSTTHFLL